MNKLKNIGISALAGTLVSLSAAQAGGVSVSGSYELTYTNLDHDEVSGNKIGVNKNLSFGAGGDVSDGGGVTWSTNIALSDAAGISSASLAINMGGIATLTYDSGAGGTGANAVDNIVPTAWEEVDYGFATGITDVGSVSATKGVINLTIKAPVAGTGISLSYASGMAPTDHISDGAVGGDDGYKGLDVVVDFVDYSSTHAGFRWGVAGQMEFPERTCKNEAKNLLQGTTGDHALHSCGGGHKDNPYAGSMYTKLQLGPIHLGTQATFKSLELDKASAIKNQRSIIGGAAVVFGDTLSVSYGVGYDKYRYNNRSRGFTVTDFGEGGSDSIGKITSPEEHEYVTQRYHGYSAALNLGPVALKGTHNFVRGEDKTSIYALGDTHSELNLSIAF